MPLTPARMGDLAMQLEDTHLQFCLPTQRATLSLHIQSSLCHQYSATLGTSNCDNGDDGSEVVNPFW